MSQSHLSPVSFHGDTIFCTTIDGQPFAPVKPIIENLGLGWASQSQKLNANQERWGITIIVIPSESGDQRTLCMPVRKLPAFLASINPNKVKAELRPKIELYQAECDNALWDYWTKGKAERPVEEQAMVIEAESVRAGVHIHTFTFLHKHQVRVVTESGKLWLPVNDLGNALGYAAPANWVTMGLPKTWDGKLAFDRFYGTPSIVSPMPSKSHAPDCRVLREEAVRVMLERSTKSDADAFKNWLYGVIIPQLQKGGWYGHSERPTALESAPAGQTPAMLPAVPETNLRGYARRLAELEASIKKLMGDISIATRPTLLDAAWVLAGRRGHKDIAPLAITFLAPLEEARNSVNRGFTLARHALESAEYLAGDSRGALHRQPQGGE